MKTPFCLPFAVAAFALWHPNPAHGQNINPAAGPTALPNDGRAEGFVMINNRMHVVRQGVATPLQEEMVLRVTPAGIVGFDGMSRIISNDAMLGLDGRIVAAPPVQVVAPAAVARTDVPETNTGSPYVVYGTNLSGLSPSRPVMNRNSGPRFISAKKSTAVKSRSSTVRKSAVPRATSAKRTTPAPAVPFPAFDDDVLRLPDLEAEAALPPNPTIDATSTMLYMTASPTAAWSPETASIRASLGMTPPSEALTEAPAAEPLPLPTPPAPAIPAVKAEIRE